MTVRDWLALAPEKRPAATYRGDPVIGVVDGDDDEACVGLLPIVWIITDRGTATQTYGASLDTELDTEPVSHRRVIPCTITITSVERFTPSRADESDIGFDPPDTEATCDP